MKSMVIVADSSFVIETVRLVLRSSGVFTVIGKVDGRGPVGTAIAEAQPDIVLVDEMQSSDDALERIRECREALPSATVVLITIRMEDAWVTRAIAAGAAACLSKSAHLPSLGTLIREVVNHNIVCAPPSGISEGSVSLPGNEGLTAREREILELAAHGLTNAQIGKQLWVTQQTVKFHLSNIYRKLGVSNRTEASSYAHLHGMTPRPGPRLVPIPDTAGSVAPVHGLRRVSTAGAA
jgi:DNA-binding NarL/FixJ family response regulator